MNSCPCCGRRLLRHIRHGNICWFCTSCWQEMPNLDSLQIYIHRCHLKPKPCQIHNDRPKLCPASICNERSVRNDKREVPSLKPKELELAGRK